MVRSHSKITRKKPIRIESVAKRKCSVYNSWHENKCYIPRTTKYAAADDIPPLTDFSFGRLRTRHLIIKGADLIKKYEESASWKHTLGKSYYTNRSIVPELNYFYDPTRVELKGDRAKKAVRRRHSPYGESGSKFHFERRRVLRLRERRWSNDQPGSAL